jgi:hypothetical protein
LLGFGRTNIGFNSDVDLGTRLKGYWLSFFILQNILDADLPVELVRAVNPNLRVLGLDSMCGRNDFFNCSGEGTDGFPVSGLSSCVGWSSGSILRQRRGPAPLSTIDWFFKVPTFTATPINSQTKEKRTRPSVA